MKSLWTEFRWWLVLIIAVIGTAHVMAYKQHRATAQYQTHRASYCASIGGTAKEKITCEEEKYDAKSDLPWWAILYTWPEGMTVWAIIGTGFIIAWQSHESRKAAIAAEKAADASLGQTSHMVNAERPFLMIEVRGGGFAGYDFWAVNHGKSPAQLLFLNPVPIVSASKFGEELEKNPWYGHGFYEDDIIVFNEQWVPPGGERNIGTLDQGVIQMWVEGHPELNTGGKELLVRGAIKYRGRFSEDVWHSKYCYRVFSNSIKMAGPYGWNEYT